MPRRRDYSSSKSHKYKPPRRSVQRDKLKKEIVKRRFKFFLSLFVSIVFLACLVYWFFFADLFLIKQVVSLEVNGEKKQHAQLINIIQEELSVKKIYIFPASNFWLVKPKSIEATIFDLQKQGKINPPIQFAKIKKKWPNKLLLEFKQRVPRIKIVVLREITAPRSLEENQELASLLQSDYYLIDNQGVVVRKGVNLKDQYQESPVLWLKNQQVFSQEQVILEPEFLNQILNLYELVLEQEQIAIKRFWINLNKQNEIKIDTTDGYYIIFNLDYSLQEQINNLILLLSKVGDRVNKELEYIDLRIKNRAYACCNLNL